MDTCKNIKNTEYILENISMKGDASLISENLEGKGWNNWKKIKQQQKIVLEAKIQAMLFSFFEYITNMF